jgi:hypothetical protein
MAFSFGKLLVYQKAIDLSDAICQDTERFPRGYGFSVDQLNRKRPVAGRVAKPGGRAAPQN